MLFKPHHVPLILTRRKVATRRVWKTTRAVPGRIHRVKTKLMVREYFAKILILDVFKQRLGDMTEEDAWMEGCDTLEDYKKEFTKINGYWDDNLVVDVVRFDLLGAH